MFWSFFKSHIFSRDWSVLKYSLLKGSDIISRIYVLQLLLFFVRGIFKVRLLLSFLLFLQGIVRSEESCCLVLSCIDLRVDRRSLKLLLILSNDCLRILIQWGCCCDGNTLWKERHYWEWRDRCLLWTLVDNF